MIDNIDLLSISPFVVSISKRQRKTFIHHFVFGKAEINHLSNLRINNRNDNTW